ncbi:MAG TPA: hypothetical protein VFQ72_02000 [Candidatus Paceibacterota bacterium]|nr:hypothetical protein [Candidatus Paceibacterota bacterium]
MDTQQIAEKILSVGKAHSLNLEQIGMLESIVRDVVEGRTSAGDFVSSIEDALNLEDDELTSLAADINLEVLMPIRESLIEDQASDTEEDLTEKETDDTRESILAEIENPSPTVHPISAADQTVAGPAAAREVIAERLSQPVSSPAQTIVVPPKAPEKPRGYAVDPYREPIN